MHVFTKKNRAKKKEGPSKINGKNIGSKPPAGQKNHLRKTTGGVCYKREKRPKGIREKEEKEHFIV